MRGARERSKVGRDELHAGGGGGEERGRIEPIERMDVKQLGMRYARGVEV